MEKKDNQKVDSKNLGSVSKNDADPKFLLNINDSLIGK